MGSRGMVNSIQDNDRIQIEESLGDSVEDAGSNKSKMFKQESEQNYDNKDLKMDFDKTQLLAYMAQLEDDSLFKIGLV